MRPKRVTSRRKAKVPVEIEQDRKRIIQLARQPTLPFYELSLLIAKLADSEVSGLLSDLPLATGMSRRRMYYLLSVGRLLTHGTIEKQLAEEVGWTKLQIIARHFEETEIEPIELRDVMARSRATNVIGVRELLSEQAGETPKRAFVFHLDRGQAAELRSALLAFGAEEYARRGLRRKELALFQIIDAALSNAG